MHGRYIAHNSPGSKSWGYFYIIPANIKSSLPNISIKKIRRINNVIFITFLFLSNFSCCLCSSSYCFSSWSNSIFYLAFLYFGNRLIKSKKIYIIKKDIGIISLGRKIKASKIKKPTAKPITQILFSTNQNFILFICAS